MIWERAERGGEKHQFDAGVLGCCCNQLSYLARTSQKAFILRVQWPLQTTPRRENNSAKWHNSSLSLSCVSPIPKMIAKVYNHWRVLHVNLTNLGPSPLHCSIKYSRINLYGTHCEKQVLAIQVSHKKALFLGNEKSPVGLIADSTCSRTLLCTPIITHQVLLLGSSYHNCNKVLIWRIPESISVSLFRLWVPRMWGLA